MRRIAAQAISVLSIGLLAVTPAVGQPPDGLSTLKFGWQTIAGPPPAGAVTLNGVRLMTIRGRGWPSATAAKSISETLQAAALEGMQADAIQVEQSKGGYAIMAGERRILLVDGTVASSMKSSREALAQQWAARLSAAFAGPYLSLPVISQVVPVGERRTVAVRGAWQQLQVTADEPIVEVTHDPREQVISLLGLAPGETRVVLDTGGPRLVLPVQVMKYAGRIAGEVKAEVTGRVAPEWAIKRAASAAVYRVITAEPGAWAEIGETMPDRSTITPGESTTVSVTVGLQGEGYIPVRANARVRVTNRAIAPAQAKVLMVSNRPERLPALGVWYQGRVPAGYPARLLYHHVNAADTDAELAVELVNPTSRPLRVQIVEASGGPTKDEIFAGHRAARDFLKRQFHDVGYVVLVPDGCTYTACASLVKPGQIISGLAEVRLLDAGELRVHVRLRPPTPDLIVPTIAVPERLSTWMFSEPTRRVTATYRVGQPWAFVTIGDRQVLSSTGHELLDGDYGVLYDVTFTVENPTSSSAEIELALMPGGGLARGVVMIDGSLYETRLLRHGETERLYELRVAPDTHRKVHVCIMPQAGSNYPVKLVMRPCGAWH